MPQETDPDGKVFPSGQTGEAKCNDNGKLEFADRSVLDKTDAE